MGQDKEQDYRHPGMTQKIYIYICSQLHQSTNNYQFESIPREPSSNLLHQEDF